MQDNPKIIRRDFPDAVARPQLACGRRGGFVEMLRATHGRMPGQIFILAQYQVLFEIGSPQQTWNK